MIMTNHTYDVIGSMFPQKEMGGGRFKIRCIINSLSYQTKRKRRSPIRSLANIIHCKNYKSRLTKENAQIDVKLTYKKRFRQILWSY